MKILKPRFVESFKMALFRATTKTKVSVFICFDSFVTVLLMEIISHDTHLNYMAFPKQNTLILISFDLNSILARQTSEKVAYKPGLDKLLEC